MPEGGVLTNKRVQCTTSSVTDARHGYFLSSSGQLLIYSCSLFVHFRRPMIVWLFSTLLDLHRLTIILLIRHMWNRTAPTLSAYAGNALNARTMISATSVTVQEPTTNMRCIGLSIPMTTKVSSYRCVPFVRCFCVIIDLTNQN